jgi:hypothetical protein
MKHSRDRLPLVFLNGNLRYLAFELRITLFHSNNAEETNRRQLHIHAPYCKKDYFLVTRPLLCCHFRNLPPLTSQMFLFIASSGAIFNGERTYMLNFVRTLFFSQEMFDIYYIFNDRPDLRSEIGFPTFNILSTTFGIWVFVISV